MQACRLISPVDEWRFRNYTWYKLVELALWQPDIIHYNFSRSYKRGISTVLGRLMRSAVVHTIHGDQFDVTKFGNRIALRFSSGVIVLNDSAFSSILSADISIRVEKISPMFSESQCVRSPSVKLPMKIAQLIPLNRKCMLVYARSRGAIRGQEIYGFEFIAGLLPSISNLGFHVLYLDPSNAYNSLALDPQGVGNTLHIVEDLDFRALLEYVSVYVRPTASDGNSIAILEALDAGLPVLCSDVVDRPSGTITYKYGCRSDFISQLKMAANQKDSIKRPPQLDSISKYIEFLERAIDEPG